MIHYIHHNQPRVHSQESIAAAAKLLALGSQLLAKANGVSV